MISTYRNACGRSTTWMNAGRTAWRLGTCRRTGVSSRLRRSLAARYKFAGGYRMEMAGFEILEKAEKGFLSGDMNGFTGTRVFTDDRRKVLLIRLRQA